MLLTSGAAILVIGVLIFVHELGHFMAAKWVGIGVHRFSLGLGPLTPLSFRWGETTYVISWIPIGGYVKMASKEEQEEVGGLEGGSGEQEFPQEKLFENKPLWARVFVISDGVTINVLFAWVVYFWLATSYDRVVDLSTTIPLVDVSTLPTEAPVRRERDITQPAYASATSRSSSRTPNAVPPLGTVGLSRLDQVTPAMSRCAQATSSLTKRCRILAAVMLPASRPPIFFMSAICERTCSS